MSMGKMMIRLEHLEYFVAYCFFRPSPPGTSPARNLCHRRPKAVALRKSLQMLCEQTSSRYVTSWSEGWYVNSYVVNSYN